MHVIPSVVAPGLCLLAVVLGHPPPSPLRRGSHSSSSLTHGAAESGVNVERAFRDAFGRVSKTKDAQDDAEGIRTSLIGKHFGRLDFVPRFSEPVERPTVILTRYKVNDAGLGPGSDDSTEKRTLLAYRPDTPVEKRIPSIYSRRVMVDRLHSSRSPDS